MNITPFSMESMIMRNVDDINADPHLKKLLEELKALKNELNGPKVQTKSFNESPATAPIINPIKNVKRKKRRQTEGSTDSAFRSSVYISAVRRKSDRLSGKTISFEFMDDIDDLENKTLYSNGRLRLAEGVYKPRHLIPRRHRSTVERIIFSPEEVTEEILNGICYNVNDKVYDKENGSCCHQCRQKTRDTKTVCRNLDCVGLRGQFCGPCSQNRYGVDVAVALKDPYWSCFVCQGVCNCSFCRSRQGKMPTGILTHIAKREGHGSVKDFLDDLKLQIAKEDDHMEKMNDPESLLGFKNDNKVVTVNGKEDIYLGELSYLKAHLIKEIIEDFDCYFCGFTDDCVVTSNEKVKVLCGVYNCFQNCEL